MKHESKFGLGEIVCYDTKDSKGKIVGSELYKVVSVTFTIDDLAHYCVRATDGKLHQFYESELIGDKEFNQESGGYESDSN